MAKDLFLLVFLTISYETLVYCSEMSLVWQMQKVETKSQVGFTILPLHVCLYYVCACACVHVPECAFDTDRYTCSIINLR